MIRLKDIAARAGCSVMTVSKCLRDEPDVSAATTARIKKLAAEMGYIPDVFAQALRTRASKLLGVIIPATTNPVFSRTLLALEERAHEMGFQIILAHSLGSPEREEACIQRMLARRVQGLFIHPVYRLQKEVRAYRELEKAAIPTVILGHHAPFTAHFANVETDDLLGSYQLTQHLLALGHTQIAFFTGQVTASASQERFEGYRRALREAGFDCNEKLIFQSGNTIEDGAKAALEFLNEAAPATAIQCDNDLVAIGAADTLLNQGVKIPDDLSLAGFGNILVAEYFRVPLTTVRQPKHRLGLAAMEVLQKLLAGEKPASVRLPAPPVFRASTAAVKKT
jgi:DNA-binding LacI/PurR family transcriptional regulator